VRSSLDETARQEHGSRNLIHSVLLMMGMGAVLAAAAGIVWGWPGVIGAFAAMLAVAFGAPRLPPEALMRLYRGSRVAPGAANPFGALAATLAERAGLPHPPALYVIPSMTLGAFAAGSRERSAIAVTEGLLRRLTMREIAGVLAHEVSHIGNGDLRVMGIADAMTRFVQSLSYLALVLAIFNVWGLMTGEEGVSWLAILLLYLSPALLSLLQLGLSRTREYDADLDGATLTGDPMGLAAALSRLEHHTGEIWEDLMFPVPGRRVPVPSLLRTHPPVEKRIARLHDIVFREPVEPIVMADEPMVSLVGVGPIQMRPRFRWPGVWF